MSKIKDIVEIHPPMLRKHGMDEEDLEDSKKSPYIYMPDKKGREIGLEEERLHEDGILTESEEEVTKLKVNPDDLFQSSAGSWYLPWSNVYNLQKK